jgi:predicted DNA-binding transcriptional regulator AlpA
MLVTANDVAELLQVSKPMLYKLMNGPQGFPRPIRLGVSVRWDSVEIESWIEAQKAKRDGLPVGDTSES